MSADRPTTGMPAVLAYLDTLGGFAHDRLAPEAWRLVETRSELARHLWAAVGRCRCEGDGSCQGCRDDVTLLIELGFVDSHERWIG